MEKGIILYQSKYGATKKYAEWLKEATQFECMETKKADIKKVQEYDVIILGGGTMILPPIIMRKSASSRTRMAR